MELPGPGIIQGIHNTNAFISSFVRACFEYSLDQKDEIKTFAALFSLKGSQFQWYFYPWPLQGLLSFPI
jgi:hypothetical protein